MWPKIHPCSHHMACHQSPSNAILLPFMDPIIAQISRWWIAKSIICQSVNINHFSTLFHTNTPVPNLSLHHDSHPFNLASLDFQVESVPLSEVEDHYWSLSQPSPLEKYPNHNYVHDHCPRATNHLDTFKQTLTFPHDPPTTSPPSKGKK